MVRVLSIVVLVLLLMSKTFYSLFWQTYFYMNQKEIAAIECVNKDRPEMDCGGKCYLAKQLEKADEDLAQKKSERSRSLDNIKKSENSPFSIEPLLSFEDFKEESNGNEFVMLGYSNHYEFTFHSQILDPPRS